MTFKFGFGEATILVVVAFLVLAMLFLPPYDRPPLASVQNGFRGTGMAQIYNPRTVSREVAQNQLPEQNLPPLVEAGPRAADAYQNVQVLGDLSAAQFLRLMTAITNWVSPEQGCNYCHQGNNFADDTPYAKRVSRWMIHMTRTLNTEWASHVQQAWKDDIEGAGEAGGAGVNCYTCHRGNNVPQYVWYADPSLTAEQGMAGYRAGQNRPAEQTLLASLPANFSEYHLTEESPEKVSIRVQGDIALPAGNRASIKQTEMTYALMIHMSGSLGVNCTYCHNSRAWGSWEQSTPQRTTAWYGIQMTQAVNQNYIAPSVVALPEHRIVNGLPAMGNCTTCHQNVYKPLYGADMVSDFPGLNQPNYVERERIEPGLASAETSMAIGAEIKAAGLATGGTDAAAEDGGEAAPAGDTGDAAATDGGDEGAAPAQNGAGDGEGAETDSSQ